MSFFYSATAWEWSAVRVFMKLFCVILGGKFCQMIVGGEGLKSMYTIRRKNCESQFQNEMCVCFLRRMEKLMRFINAMNNLSLLLEKKFFFNSFRCVFFLFSYHLIRSKSVLTVLREICILLEVVKTTPICAQKN